jgi:hypothetical protein
VQASIQYVLVFDDEPQQKRFFSFLKRLKATYPEQLTIAARIDAHIAEQA